VVWLDAGTLSVAPLDWATALVGGNALEGEVFVAPEQLLSPPDQIDGRLLESRAAVPADRDCNYLPGAELPVLGQAVQWGAIRAAVVALDPANDRVTIAPGDGGQTVVPLKDLSDG
jgi:hypothetical protein